MKMIESEAHMSDTAVASPPTAEPAEPERLAIRPWPDPVIDQVGHDPRSAYVEQFWLGVLGPSTIWLMRRIAGRLERSPDGFELDPVETGAALGLAARQGPQSPIRKSLDRGCTFGVARLDGSTYLVRRKFPPLTRRQLQRLPGSVQQLHRAWLERDVRRPVAGQVKLRARLLAHALVELGDDYDAVEAQLHRWHFHPAVAHDAVRWAFAHTAARPPSARLAEPSGQLDEEAHAEPGRALGQLAVDVVAPRGPGDVEVGPRHAGADELLQEQPGGQ
jgi:hypothetical protein